LHSDWFGVQGPVQCNAVQCSAGSVQGSALSSQVLGSTAEVTSKLDGRHFFQTRRQHDDDLDLTLARTDHIMCCGCGVQRPRIKQHPCQETHGPRNRTSTDWAPGCSAVQCSAVQCRHERYLSKKYCCTEISGLCWHIVGVSISLVLWRYRCCCGQILLVLLYWYAIWHIAHA
jgi:hypothetical protein